MSGREDGGGSAGDGAGGVGVCGEVRGGGGWRAGW